jgi:gliding motility-associated-like protein
VSVSNACATVSDSIELKYAENTLSLLFHDDVAICDGKSAWIGVDFDDTNLVYKWSTGQTTPIISVSDYGSYTLTVSNGCVERTKEVKINENKDCCLVFLPDAFTPNGDTNNDFYKAYTACTLNDFELVIFDRWGTMLYRTTNQDEAWDGTFNGKVLSPGVFVWRVIYNDGKFDHTDSGTLTLIK